MKDFFTNNPLWHEKIGKIYALLERVKISEGQSKDVLHLRRTNRILSVGFPIQDIDIVYITFLRDRTPRLRKAWRLKIPLLKIVFFSLNYITSNI
jgi:hypothetical protein